MGEGDVEFQPPFVRHVGICASLLFQNMAFMGSGTRLGWRVRVAHARAETDYEGSCLYN